MLIPPQERRPSRRQILAAVSTPFSHPMLRLMPYGALAPTEFEELQTLAYWAVDKRRSAGQRAEALASMCELYDHGFIEVPRRWQLIEDDRPAQLDAGPVLPGGRDLVPGQTRHGQCPPRGRKNCRHGGRHPDGPEQQSRAAAGRPGTVLCFDCAERSRGAHERQVASRTGPAAGTGAFGRHPPAQALQRARQAQGQAGRAASGQAAGVSLHREEPVECLEEGSPTASA